MDYLEVADEHNVDIKSSISQAKDTKFSVSNGVGGYLPIVSDKLDYIDCDKVKSHRIIMSLIDELDYQYPVDECIYWTDEYIYSDGTRTELRTLPHWAGEGFFQKYVDTHAFIVSDKETLGTRNKQKVQIGLSYASARITLD